MRQQKLHGLDDAFADRQPGFPAERANLARVEKDEWIVADPAALAARVFKPRLYAHLGADPADRLVDLAVFIRAQVIQSDFRGRFYKRELNGIETVLNIKVGLALFA